jgi:ABC-2 type transport system permease protein
MLKRLNLLSSIFAVSKKEFIQLRRDWRFMFSLLFIPAILLILYGYALNFDVKNVSFGVIDFDRSEISRDFVNSLRVSEYFKLKDYFYDYKEGFSFLQRREISFLLVIPEGFKRSMERMENISVQCFIDGSNSNKGTIVLGYLNAYVNYFNHKFLKKEFFGVSLRIYYNQKLKTTNFLIPGLIGFILMITTVLSTSLSVVREKERKTLEQLYVTPLSSLEFSIGKILPYIVISLLATLIIILFSKFLFGIDIRGSSSLLFLSTCLYISCTLLMGFLISTIAETQRTAFLLAILTSLLPSILLSGFIFPIENMPKIIQFITYFVPARYYIKSIRYIVLKGASLYSFSYEILSLLIFSFLLLILILRRMRLGLK